MEANEGHESFEDAIEAPPGFDDDAQAQAAMSAALGAWLSDEGAQYEFDYGEFEEKDLEEEGQGLMAPPGFEQSPTPAPGPGPRAIEPKEVEISKNAVNNNANNNKNNNKNSNSNQNANKKEKKDSAATGLGRGAGRGQKPPASVAPSSQPQPQSQPQSQGRGSQSKPQSSAPLKGGGARGASVPSKHVDITKPAPSAAPSASAKKGPLPVTHATAPSLDSKDPKEDLESSEEEECLVCCERIRSYALGPCSHRALCAPCVLRLRVLYRDLRCPVCKEQQRSVFVTRDKTQSHVDLTTKALAQRPLRLFEDATALAQCDDEGLWAELSAAWAITCPEPTCNAVPAFRSIGGLREHLRKEHGGASWCELCREHGKRYTREQPRYVGREALRQHALSHPRCAFCAQSFFDDEALFLHCTSVHESCFLCDRAGIRHQYFRDYAHLWRHFEQRHHVCPDPQCRALKFIAFASAIELQAHRVAQHRDSLSKEERRINIDVHLAPRGGQAGLRLLNNPDDPLPSTSTSTSANASGSSSLGSGSSGGGVGDASAMSFAEHKPEGDQRIAQGATFHDTPLPKDDQERNARNKALRRALVTALGEERARAFGMLSGDMRAGKVSAAHFVNDTALRFGAALSLFKELVALLPDEPRRRALLEAYQAKLLATKAQQGEFPTLAQPSSSTGASASASTSLLGALSGPASTFVPNASVGPSYRSVARSGASGASGGSAAWSGVAGASGPSLSSANAFPELPTAPARGRGNAAANSAWGTDNHGANANNNNNNSGGQGRGKRGKKVLSAW